MPFCRVKLFLLILMFWCNYQCLARPVSDTVAHAAALQAQQQPDTLRVSLLNKQSQIIKLLTDNARLINKQNRQQKIVMIFAIAGLLAAILMVTVLLINNSQKRRAYAALRLQQEELKTTQNQLIQSEKMASLGELTAGIAHEIQNPLNFVNNFAEVSIEMMVEMELELKKGDTDEAIAIASDIKQNLEKIQHHGNRAAGIVKSMLQHSRASTGNKELNNINTLADEYLRLAYHGLRAKDKGFNAQLDTNFDESLPQINMLPQDMGRVLLNLYTNAFYAVQQKQKIAGVDYKPTVTVTTLPQFDKGLVVGVQVIVQDNGEGIPDAIKDKVLQPFFTTKPTGEGTGLGLSLSYDIVVKGHGGSIAIDTVAGQYTRFIITLPV